MSAEHARDCGGTFAHDGHRDLSASALASSAKSLPSNRQSVCASQLTRPVHRQVELAAAVVRLICRARSSLLLSGRSAGGGNVKRLRQQVCARSVLVLDAEVFGLTATSARNSPANQRNDWFPPPAAAASFLGRRAAGAVVRAATGHAAARCESIFAHVPSSMIQGLAVSE